MSSLEVSISQDLNGIETSPVNYDTGVDTIKEEKKGENMDSIGIDQKPDLQGNHNPIPGTEISHVKVPRVKPYECGICTKKFSDRYKLQRHQLIHTGEKPYTCDVCQKAFTRKDKMNLHKKKMHVYPSTFLYQDLIAKDSNEKEDSSEETYSDKKYDLHQMNNDIHTDHSFEEKPIENNVDISEFLELDLASDANLIKKEIIHALQENGPTKEIKTFDFKVNKPVMLYNCDNCKTDFTCQASLLIHNKTCSNPKREEYHSYFCDEECGKSFKTSAMKNKHMESHMKIECSICDKNFTRKETLTKHMRIHTGEKPFSCDLCEKVYAYKSDMNQHKKVCANKNQVEKLGIICFICNKSFTRKQSLIQHVRLHTGERPYACNLCGQAFTSNSHVHRHKNLIHKKTTNIPNEPNIKLELEETFVNDNYKASTGCEMNRVDIKDEVSGCKTEDKIKMESPEDQDFKTESIEVRCSPTLEGEDFSKYLTNNEMNHERVDVYPCKICSQVFDEKGQLVAHQISHLEGNQWSLS